MIIIKMRPKEISIDIYSPEFAEMVGVILGDGHVSKDGKRVGIYFNKHEMQYVSYVEYLLNKLNIPHHTYERQTKVEILTYRQQLNMLLHRLGVKRGNKLTNGCKIPKFILDNNQLVKRCLRGLFDTDGSMSMNQNTPQIYLSNYSKTILKSAREGLVRLGFTPTITKRSIMLYALQAVKFIEVIGTKNEKNEKKVGLIKRYKMKKLLNSNH